ncbi:hypothetical protein LXL04_036866 [Taraxacum kok-saghyz]
MLASPLLLKLSIRTIDDTKWSAVKVVAAIAYVAAIGVAAIALRCKSRTDSLFTPFQSISQSFYSQTIPANPLSSGTFTAIPYLVPLLPPVVIVIPAKLLEENSGDHSHTIFSGDSITPKVILFPVYFHIFWPGFYPPPPVGILPPPPVGILPPPPAGIFPAAGIRPPSLLFSESLLHHQYALDPWEPQEHTGLFESYFTKMNQFNSKCLIIFDKKDNTSVEVHRSTEKLDWTEIQAKVHRSGIGSR